MYEARERKQEAITFAFPGTACPYESVHQSLGQCHSFPPAGCLPTLGLASAVRGLQERERDGATTDFSPPCRIIDSPLNRLPSPARYQHLQTSDDGDLTTDGSTTEHTSSKKRQRSRGSRSSRSGKSDGSTSASNRSASSNEERKKKDRFSSKSISLNSVVGKATPAM